MIEILIIEDNPSKRAHLNAALLEVPGISQNSITEVSTVTAATKAMQSRRYDLVVLDIALPFVEGGAVERDAGVKLLEQVLARPDIFETPTHFVGITGYQEISDAFAGRFASWLWTLAVYVPGRTEWVESLQARAKHLVNAIDAAENDHKPHIDCCILTALYNPELVAIRAQPFNWKQESQRSDDTIYWTGGMPGTDGELRLALCSSARMGMPAAATAAGKLIRYYRPKLLVVCGIMAGVKNRTAVGDVIVPNLCWDWGNGKWVADENGGSKFLPAPHQTHVSPLVRERVKLLAGDRELLHEPWRNWRGAKPATPPQLRMGPIASGAAVLADKTTIDRLISEHRELLGIEMELYGVAVAAEEASRPRPEVLGLKAVVDFADGAKSDSYQDYGAYMSAEALRLVIPVLLR